MPWRACAPSRSCAAALATRGDPEPGPAAAASGFRQPLCPDLCRRRRLLAHCYTAPGSELHRVIVQTQIIVLAAGKGTRMRSALPKVLHLLAGKPLLAHVLETVRSLPDQRTWVVVGAGMAAVQQACVGYPVSWVEQREQLGTAHAV
ncbi:MAG: hypothetical protein EPO03_09050, partial [Porticoccaceae bacterium]